MRASTRSFTCIVLVAGVCSCGGSRAPATAGPGDASPEAAATAVEGAVPLDGGPWGQAAVVPALDIAPGLFFTCAHASSGTVKCWGDNAYGMLGNGTTADSTTPVSVASIQDSLAVSVTGYNGCSLAPSGDVNCWGDNFGGQLGVTNVTDSDVPMQVPGVGHAVQLAVGRDFDCVLLSNRTVTCWGENSRGQLGNGTLGGSPYFMQPAKQVVLLDGVAAVSAGYSHACALLVDGTVRCWGDDQSQQLGATLASGDSPVPVTVPGLTAVTAIAAGWAQTCALRSDGSVWCWGNNTHGELGNGAAMAGVTSSATPVKVPSIAGATAISAHETACALLSDRTVVCWGRNETGTLGNGSPMDSDVPVPVTGLTDVTGIVTGDTHTCAALVGGKYACWGNNQYGQLGDGTTTSSGTPVTVTVL
jgi:alpha-tubulin suppressor-like RCC1 family protein